MLDWGEEGAARVGQVSGRATSRAPPESQGEEKGNREN